MVFSKVVLFTYKWGYLLQLLSHNHALSNKEVEKEVGKVRQRWVNLCKFNAVSLASRLSLEQWPGRPRSQKLGESRLGRLYIYIALHCHHQNDFCIKMGSGESHFNISSIACVCVWGGGGGGGGEGGMSQRLCP